MDIEDSTARAVAPEQGGNATEELAYRLRQQRLTAEYGHFALRTHDAAALLQEATRVCALGLQSGFCKAMEFPPGEGRSIVRASVGWRPGIVGQVGPGRIREPDRLRLPDRRAGHLEPPGGREPVPDAEDPG